MARASSNHSRILGTNDAPAGGVTVTGTTTEDQFLTADTSTLADADGLGTLHYQWQRDSGGGFGNVGLDQATYTLRDTDVGATVRVVVSYSDGHGAAETVTSGATAAVANINDAPAGAVTIAGTARASQFLTADTSTLADADGLGALHYQWQRDGGGGFNNVGLDQANYMLGGVDVGATIRVAVSYTDGHGTAESVTSAASAVVASNGINHAPVVNVPVSTVQATAGQTFQVSNLFSATDADNNTLAYLFYDATVGGGHFEVNGVTQAAGQIFAVNAAQLAQTTFVPAVDGSDNLLVGASDGVAFSGWSNLHIDGPVNHAPAVIVPDPIVEAMAGQTLQLSSLFTATDADNDTLAYVFYDGTPGGGHFEVNGVTQAAGQIFAVTAAQLAQTTFVPAANASDDLLVGASDGHMFSGWSNLHVDGPVNHAPVVTVPDPMVDVTPNQTLQMSSLFTATDADNDTLTYAFYDATPGGGHFEVNGVTQASNQIFGVTAAQLAQTTFVAGPNGTDDLLVGASDGHIFSGWSNLEVVGATPMRRW